MLCSKLAQTQQLKKHALLSLSDFGSGIQVWLSGVLCSRSHKAAVRVSAWNAVSSLKNLLHETSPSKWLLQTLRSCTHLYFSDLCNLCCLYSTHECIYYPDCSCFKTNTEEWRGINCSSIDFPSPSPFLCLSSLFLLTLSSLPDLHSPLVPQFLCPR